VEPKEVGYPWEPTTEFYGLPTTVDAQAACDQAHARGELTWAHVAVEELCESVDAPDDVQRREELVQLAAVCVAWIESIDRRLGK
jgi:hypothetical protein